MIMITVLYSNYGFDSPSEMVYRSVELGGREVIHIRVVGRGGVVLGVAGVLVTRVTAPHHPHPGTPHIV